MSKRSSKGASNIAVIALGALVVVLIAASAFLYVQNTTLAGNYNQLQNNYATLNSNYNALLTNYNTLLAQKTSLESQVDNLSSQLAALNSSYISLQGDYAELEADCQDCMNPGYAIFIVDAYNSTGAYIRNTGNGSSILAAVYINNSPVDVSDYAISGSWAAATVTLINIINNALLYPGANTIKLVFNNAVFEFNIVH